jgi:8-oxo-dGTP pyrophosphatase MutT (NUDIX family)
MSFLDRIRACNTYDLSNYLPFRIDRQQVGWIRPALRDILAERPDVFMTQPDYVSIAPRFSTIEQRTAAIDRISHALVKHGIIPRWHGERYPVTARDRLRPLLLIDRAASSAYGVRTFGQHLNGFVRTPAGLRLWVARRAADKPTYPGMLDNLVAGGLPYGVALADNLAKECWEEAAIPPPLAARARPVGAISYCWETPGGLKPDVMFTYDLELPERYTPRCTDGEVESFELWPVEQVAEMVQSSTAFKPNCNLVIIDFLIRHGVISADDPDYLELVTGLRRPLNLAALHEDRSLA